MNMNTLFTFGLIITINGQWHPCPDPDSNCEHMEFCLGKNDGNYPNPAGYTQNCYISCKQHNLSCIKCYNDNDIYDAASDSCAPPELEGKLCPSSDCIAPREVCLNKPSDGNYQNDASYPQNCYISCTDGIDTCMKCRDNLVYDETAGYCVSPELQGKLCHEWDCPAPGEFCLNQVSDGNYQNDASYPQNCYISCTDGRDICMKCADNLVYDPVSDSCKTQQGQGIIRRLLDQSTRRRMPLLSDKDMDSNSGNDGDESGATSGDQQPGSQDQEGDGEATEGWWDDDKMRKKDD